MKKVIAKQLPMFGEEESPLVRWMMGRPKNGDVKIVEELLGETKAQLEAEFLRINGYPVLSPFKEEK